MSIKYENEKGLNERKANQGSMNIHPDYDPKNLDEKKFELYDQERVEQGAGEGGYTSGESFDKYPPERSKEKTKLTSKAIGEELKEKKDVRQ